jgi:hypothetical protein
VEDRRPRFCGSKTTTTICKQLREFVMTYIAVAHCVRLCDEDSGRPATNRAEKD